MIRELKVGVVTARFNSEVTEKLEEGAISYLEDCDGVQVYAVRVPGAVEIPVTAQTLIEAGCDGVVVLGAVIRGETSHYDYVCQSVERGITELMLAYNTPIGFGVLTTENEQQALDRAGGKHGNKGEEAAQVVMEMIGLLDQIQLDMTSSPEDVEPKAKKASKTKKKVAKKVSKKKK
jgi:6,7-dimethyl-8-ribityllumazine synthase